MTELAKIKPGHLRRTACVYLRQSSQTGLRTLVGSGMWVSSEVVERVSDSVNAACFPADE